MNQSMNFMCSEGNNICSMLIRRACDGDFQDKSIREALTIGDIKLIELKELQWLSQEVKL